MFAIRWITSAWCSHSVTIWCMTRRDTTTNMAISMATKDILPRTHPTLMENRRTDGLQSITIHFCAFLVHFVTYFYFLQLQYLNSVWLFYAFTLSCSLIYDWSCSVVYIPESNKTISIKNVAENGEGEERRRDWLRSRDREEMESCCLIVMEYRKYNGTEEWDIGRLEKRGIGLNFLGMKIRECKGSYSRSRSPSNLSCRIICSLAKSVSLKSVFFQFKYYLLYIESR